MHNLLFVTLLLPFVFVECVDLQLSLLDTPSECPGSCSSSIISCKASGGKIAGVCSDGKICCSRAVTGGFGGASPAVVTCGASVMANKVVSFRSPNYPAFSGGSMICEFTLQLNPATSGIRVDFVDLNLPSVPTNPVNFYESANSVCDSDYLMFRGFPGWSPDFRCGNLSGYSFMIEREKDQPTLSTLLIMTSPNYRWNMRYTEIYFNEVESLDYAIRSMASNGNNLNDKKQWIWYTPPGGGSALSYSPINVNIPGLPPSMLAPPSWQFAYPLRHLNGDNGGSEVSYLNSTGEVEATTFATEAEGVVNLDSQTDSHGNKSENHFSRIVGGMDAKPNSVPWQVSLQLVRKMETDLCGELRNLSSHFCGGTIIGDRTILTASHCFLSSSRHAHPLLPPQDIKVVVGEHDFCSDNEVTSTREYAIERIMLHYNYISSDVINDLAVIRLKKPIKFDKNVHPIALPDEHTKIYGLKPLLSGWGSLGVEENSTYPAILQQTSNIHIFTEEECEYYQRRFLEYVIPDYRLSGKYKAAFHHGICTKPTDNLTEAGFGDSGGPVAILSPSGPPVLVGVVSHMRPHEDPTTMQEFHLNYFGKVSAYRKWILMTMLPQ